MGGVRLLAGVTVDDLQDVPRYVSLHRAHVPLTLDLVPADHRVDDGNRRFALPRGGEETPLQHVANLQFLQTHHVGVDEGLLLHDDDLQWLPVLFYLKLGKVAGRSLVQEASPFLFGILLVSVLVHFSEPGKTAGTGKARDILEHELLFRERKHDSRVLLF